MGQAETPARSMPQTARAPLRCRIAAGMAAAAPLAAQAMSLCQGGLESHSLGALILWWGLFAAVVAAAAWGAVRVWRALASAPRMRRGIGRLAALLAMIAVCALAAAALFLVLVVRC